MLNLKTHILDLFVPKHVANTTLNQIGLPFIQLNYNHFLGPPPVIVTPSTSTANATATVSTNTTSSSTANNQSPTVLVPQLPKDFLNRLKKGIEKEVKKQNKISFNYVMSHAFQKFSANNISNLEVVKNVVNLKSKFHNNNTKADTYAKT